jgi:hypothetical protein
MQNFSSLARTQTDLDTFLTIFEEYFWIFQENSVANSKKFHISKGLKLRPKTSGNAA